MRSGVRVGLVVALQLGILAVIPARQVAARAWGTPVTLRTGPVDPFDVLSGHYVTLVYDIERDPPALGTALRDGDEVWFTVRQASPAWELVGVGPSRPAPASGQVAIRGRWQRGWSSGWAHLDGAHRFYCREDQARALGGSRQARPTLVDLRIGWDGTPALMALRTPDGKVIAVE